ncbi:glutaredoxin, partial [Vibrio cholerae]|nr:glutaredoxin [Vibrio cholerae]
MPKIEIYTKSYCPYCKAAKQTLNSMGLSYREVEVSTSQALFNE